MSKHFRETTHQKLLKGGDSVKSREGRLFEHCWGAAKKVLWGGSLPVEKNRESGFRGKDYVKNAFKLPSQFVQVKLRKRGSLVRVK